MYQVELHADKQKRLIIVDDKNYCLPYFPYEMKGHKNSYYATVSGFKFKGSIPMGDNRTTPDEAIESLLSWLRNALDPNDTKADWQ